MQNPLPAMQSFIFGDGQNAPTYESLKRRREIADLLKMQAVGQAPRNVGEGIASIGKALAARWMDNKLGPQEDAARKSISDILGGMGGGGFSGPVAGAPGGFTGAGYSGNPDTLAGGTPVGSPMMNFRNAIAGVESAGSGDYAAVGPEVKGDRAYGRYQIMGANIPDWSMEALGRPVTTDEFMANPEMQDAIFDHRFGGYVNKYGPEGAARAWFSGEGGMNNPNASDGYITNDQYAAKFNAGLGGGGILDAAGMGQPDMGRLAQLADVLGNPYASEGQRVVAQALIEREIGKGEGDALGWARLALDREKFAQGTREGPKFYGNVQWADRTPDDGIDNPVPYQLSTDNQVNWVDLGGAIPLPPVKNINTGTEYQVQGPGGTQVAPPIAIDNSGKAAATEFGQASGKAAASLGDKGVMVDAAIDQIDRILADPALPEVLGNIQGRIAPRTQAQANVQAQIDGLGGKVFANAISALIGLGAMSNMEGQAASQSLASLAQIQDEKAYAAELGRLKALLLDKLEAAKRLAGQGDGPQSGVTEDGYRFKGGDPADPNNWEKVGG